MAMVLPSELLAENEKKVEDALKFVLVAIVGACAVGIFWGIWHNVAGSTPKFLGVPRLWLDVASMAALAPVWFVYIAIVASDRREMMFADEEDPVDVSWWEPLLKYPGIGLAGLFLVLVSLAGAYWSFVVSVVAVIALVALVVAYRGGRWLVKRACELKDALWGLFGWS